MKIHLPGAQLCGGRAAGGLHLGELGAAHPQQHLVARQGALGHPERGHPHLLQQRDDLLTGRDSGARRI